MVRCARIMLLFREGQVQQDVRRGPSITISGMTDASALGMVNIDYNVVFTTL